MALEISLQHCLELRIAAAPLDVLGQSIANDVAHRGPFDFRNGLHLLGQTLVRAECRSLGVCRLEYFWTIK